MSFKTLVREHLVLVVGLTLPILLTVGFLVAGSLPDRLADPPRYSLVFAVPDYSPGTQALPVVPRLLVKDGVLKVQYTRTLAQPGGYVNTGWKKLYLYDATARTVRELPLGVPENPQSIEGMREETVDATRSLTLDTTLQAPDGYELSYGERGRSGFINDVFWSSGYSREPRLRKGGSSVRLTTSEQQAAFGYGQVEFIGWVTGAPR